MPSTPLPTTRTSAVDADRHRASAPLLPALPCTLLCTLLFGLLLTLVAARWGPLLSLDTALSGALHRTAVAAPGWTRVNRVLSDWVWDPWTMRVLLAAAVVVLVRRGERRLAVWVVATALVGTVLQQAVKALVGRERPAWPDPVASASYSAFPSGHALTALVAGVLVLWLLRLAGARPLWRWTARLVIAVSVVGVGFTRVYLGVHWPSDVVAGWLLGGALVTGSAAAYTAYASRLDPGAAERAGWRS
ncbi:phosphatase PAP2 family protein [Streptomyces decoyicus]|uniref:phosphatase PAP2 family protein n=1 Tax=Streptomyces decoyicus TaxID=249567 RepID=UPI0004AAB849|nr:phosphatase PAP2 family protein [Streptomyces decoyicus]QZY14805.1 phosphatase PAP2 family protein [Streptomyces decoyicus]